MERLFGKIMTLLGHAEGADPKVLEGMVLKLYDELVSEYRPLIGVVPALTGKLGKDILPVVVGVIEMANAIRGDEQLRKAVCKSDKLKAEARYEAMKTYMAAGFKREEAFNLVLQDIADMKANFAKITSQSRRS
jgi:hypothetical protein